MNKPIIAINDKGEQLWWNGTEWVPIEPIPEEPQTPEMKPAVDDSVHLRLPTLPWKKDEPTDIELVGRSDSSPSLAEMAFEGKAPSRNQLLDSVPAAGAIAGSVFGLPGTAAGGGLGELLRMGLRKQSGQAPATGFVQTALDLDPNNPATAAVNVLAEAAGGPLADTTFGVLAKGAPRLGMPSVADWLERLGAGTFAGGLTRDPKSKDALAKKLLDTGVNRKLPVGGQRHQRVYAERMADGPFPGAQAGAGHDVGEVYRQVGGTPGSYLRSPGRPSVVDNLTEARDKSMAVPPNHKIVQMVDPNGLTYNAVVSVPGAFQDKPLWKAFNDSIQELIDREEKALLPRMDDMGNVGPPVGVNVASMRATRESAADQALRRSSKAFQGNTHVPPAAHTPVTQAKKAVNATVSDEIHELVPGPVTIPPRNPVGARENMSALASLTPGRVRNEVQDSLARRFPGMAQRLGIARTGSAPRVLANSIPAKTMSPKEADAIYNTWKSVAEGTPASQDILSRWLVARLWGGAGGTMAGAVAANGMLLRSASNATLRSLANALRVGDDAVISQIMKSLADQASFSNDQPTSKLQQYVNENEARQ